MTEDDINAQIEEQVQMLYAQHNPERATELAVGIGTSLDGQKNANVAVALAVVVARFATMAKRQDDRAPLPAITTGTILRIALRMVMLAKDCFEDDEVNAPSGRLH